MSMERSDHVIGPDGEPVPHQAPEREGGRGLSDLVEADAFGPPGQDALGVGCGAAVPQQ